MPVPAHILANIRNEDVTNLRITPFGTFGFIALDGNLYLIKKYIDVDGNLSPRHNYANPTPSEIIRFEEWLGQSEDERPSESTPEFVSESPRRWVLSSNGTNTYQTWFQMREGNPKPQINFKEDLLHKSPMNFCTFDYYMRCRFCGKTFKRSKMASFANERSIYACTSCLKNGHVNVKKCEKCGKLYLHSLAKCPCEDNNTNPTNVREWNYTPIYHKFGEARDHFYMGFEFEIELSRKRLDPYLPQLAEIIDNDWVYFKRDGSISHGIEIVTMPLSWEWIYTNLEKFNSIFNLKTLDCSSRLADTCGFHIHINKDSFSSLHLYKFIKFFYDNPDLVHILSGRAWSNLKRWARFTASDGISKSDVNKIAVMDAKEKRTGDKHSAVNLNNIDSVEVRIFRGTLSLNVFLRNIEFVKSLHEFTKDANLRNSSDRSLYNDYLTRHKKEFPNIYSYLVTKGEA